MGQTRRGGSGGPKSGDAKSREKEPKVGLALAGGGPGGAIYEIGALWALQESLDGIDFNRLPVYVGISAGAFISACLANQITPAQMCRAIVSPDPGEHPFVPETFLTPSFKELARRGLTVPRHVFDGLREFLRSPGDSLLGDLSSYLGRALPVGVFDNEPIRKYLHKIYTIKGRSDDFRDLDSRLVVVATDLDAGQSARFGEPGLDHIPISQAVQASGALPGLYPPVEIEGRYYVDGVLLKTMHASAALDAGATLVLCVNPIVPVDTVRAVEAGVMKRGKLIDRGLPAVLSQALRTLIHSRLTVGIEKYEKLYPETKVVLLEPKRDDYRMFFTNIFGFADRRIVCEHAYRATRAELLAQADELEPVFERHGITLRRDILLDEDRDLWAGVGLGKQEQRSDLPVVSRLNGALDRLEAMIGEG